MKYEKEYRQYEGIYQMTAEEVEARKTKYDKIAVRIGYEVGGMSYFSDSIKPRCYYLGFKPCSITGGIKSCTIMGSGWENGVNLVINETKRFSEKDLSKIASLVDSDYLGKLYANDNNEAIQVALEDLRDGKFTQPSYCENHPNQELTIKDDGQRYCPACGK